MKLQKLEWGMAARKLIPLIASGRLRSDVTEPFIHGTYLEAWFRCLKCSKEFTHSCRTGIFMSEGAAETYRLFGPLEDLNYSDWWMSKGHSFFSESITTLQVTLYMQRKDTGVFSVSVDAAQEISSQLAGREFGFWLDQIRGCTEFCVNGQMAGNRRTSRSGYDRKYKESSTQRSDRQFAG